jgi:hypothetical protein
LWIHHVQNRSISDRTLEECWSTLQRVSWNVFRSVRYIFTYNNFIIIVFYIVLFWTLILFMVLFRTNSVCFMRVYVWNFCLVIIIISLLFCSLFACMFLLPSWKVKIAFYCNTTEICLLHVPFDIIFVCHTTHHIGIVYLYITYTSQEGVEWEH